MERMDRREFLTRLLAAGSMALLAGCGAAGGEEKGEGPEKAGDDPEKGSGNVVQAEVLAAPELPAPGPDPRGEDRKAVIDDRKRRNGLREQCAGKLNRFFGSTVPYFLLHSGNTNPVFSPMNVYLALSLLAECTAENTRAQILELLGREDIEDVRKVADALWRGNHTDDGLTTLLLGNALLLREEMDYVPETVALLAEEYRASVFRGEMGSEAYDRLLQDWLNENTGGLLKEAASQIKLDADTLLALASTVYFKARWWETFQKEQTKTRTFHAPGGDREADFMHRTLWDTYYRGDGFGAVNLSFTETSASLWLVLPDEGTTPARLLQEDAIPGGLVEHSGAKSVSAQINLALPKFDINAFTDILDGLRELGLTDAMKPGTADFRGVLPDNDLEPFLSAAKHAARVKIDEEGCEAAAFTVISAAGGSMQPKEEIDFILDRPFLFFLEAPVGGVLFAGMVNEP